MCARVLARPRPRPGPSSDPRASTRRCRPSRRTTWPRGRALSSGSGPGTRSTGEAGVSRARARWVAGGSGVSQGDCAWRFVLPRTAARSNWSDLPAILCHTCRHTPWAVASSFFHVCVCVFVWSRFAWSAPACHATLPQGTPRLAPCTLAKAEEGALTVGWESPSADYGGKFCLQVLPSVLSTGSNQCKCLFLSFFFGGGR